MRSRRRRERHAKQVSQCCHGLLCCCILSHVAGLKIGHYRVGTLTGKVLGAVGSRVAVKAVEGSEEKLTGEWTVFPGVALGLV